MNAFQPIPLQQLAAHCGAFLQGDGSIPISGIASISSARPGDIVFAADEPKLKQALTSAASSVITGDFARSISSTKALLIASDAKAAFTRVAALFANDIAREGQDESAQVHLSAQIGEHVFIGPGVVIEAQARIGNYSFIGANSVICAEVAIGQRCRIGPNVTVYSGAELQDRVIVQAGTVLGSSGFGYVRDEQGRYCLFPQVGRLVVEDDVEIGANCTIDRGALDATVIRRGAKIDNMVHIGHNVDIGEDVVIAAQTGISGSSRIGNGAIVGGQVGIGEHAEVGPGTILGGQSGVLNHKVLRGKGIVFWGTPARPLKDYLRELATLARLARKKEM
jgi:UDP-3-O-[3-hydroxymyristoyl] glucosamine N-acyltransferase